jgi:hypothetical protein
MGDFLDSIIWSSLDNSKDISYRIFVLRYFLTQFQKQQSFLDNFKDISYGI